MFVRKNLIFIIILTVWSSWLYLMFERDLWHLFADNWHMSVTMAFGSFIAGATSEGGGAVAFPVMTLLFNIAPSIARDFSLMIQSVGMIAASIAIFAFGIRVEKRALIYGSIGGATGICLGLTYIAPQISPPVAKVFFTSLWLSFAVALFLINRYKNRDTVDKIVNHTNISAAVLILVGLIGGIVSSITGSGLDILTFAVLVLYFRVSEKIATPTSVVLMGVNALTGFIYKDFALGGMAAEAWNYWYVCVPIVVVGAPLGSYVIKHMHRHSIAWILYISIFAQYTAAVLIIPYTQTLWAVNIGTFLAGSVIFAVIAKMGTERRARTARYQNQLQACAAEKNTS